MKLTDKLRAAATSRPALKPSIRLLLEEAADELETYDTSFDLRWHADMRAIKRWQAANPGNDLVWPDHADLVVWLLEQLEERGDTNIWTEGGRDAARGQD